MATINVRVDDETDQQIREEAEALGLRRSDIVRMALRQWMKMRHPRTYTGKQFVEMGRNSIGSVSIDIPDLAERHEEYLREAFGGR